LAKPYTLPYQHGAQVSGFGHPDGVDHRVDVVVPDDTEARGQHQWHHCTECTAMRTDCQGLDGPVGSENILKLEIKNCKLYFLTCKLIKIHAA